MSLYLYSFVYCNVHEASWLQTAVSRISIALYRDVYSRERERERERALFVDRMTSSRHRVIKLLITNNASTISSWSPAQNNASFSVSNQLPHCHNRHQLCVYSLDDRHWSNSNRNLTISPRLSVARQQELYRCNYARIWAYLHLHNSYTSCGKSPKQKKTWYQTFWLTI